MEEVDLGGVKTGGSGRDGEVDGRDGTDSGFSGDSVGFNLFFEIIDGGFGEDEGNFLFHEGDKGLEFRDFASELLLEVFELLIFNAINSHSEDLLDEGLF